MKLLGSAWTRRPRRSHPYAWLATEPGELFDATVGHELRESFPLSSFVRREARDGGDKVYRNYSRPLSSPEGGRVDDVSPSWRALVEDLLSVEYRQAVAGVLGQAPAARVELRLVRHAPGDFLDPHTDRADKLFTHVLYFNAVWQEEWGGHLEILDGGGMVAVARIPPLLGTSALLARSEDSWHRVSRVTGAAAPERRSIVIHGLRQ
jgi:hypothetical protein